MSSRMIPLGAVLAALLGACAGQQPMANKCPNTPPVPCMTREECTYDETRGCMACSCQSADDTTPRPPASAQPD